MSSSATSSSSSSSKPKVVRWGILATGAISKVFVTDLLLDPKTRGTNDVVHKVVAVGSRSVEKARAFADEFGLGEGETKAYGDYEGVYADENVDIIYVGSPNSHHYPNTRAALLSGKAVLCEKGFTINAAQAEDLVALSQRKGVYLHEALWTRHFPVTIKLQELIVEGRIGKVERVLSDFGQDAKVDERDPSDRLIDPKLGGGAILDVSPYALCWVLVPLFPFPAKVTEPKITSQLTLQKGIDVHVSAVLTFPNLEGTVAVMTSSMRQAPPHPVIIQGSKGEIKLLGPACNPTGFVLTPHGGEPETFDYPKPEKGVGMFWEADDAARNFLAGRIESGRMPHQTSVVGMRIFDEIRRQSDHKYSDEIERVLQ